MINWACLIWHVWIIQNIMKNGLEGLVKCESYFYIINFMIKCEYDKLVECEIHYQK